ncbi:uncharacterized protein LOC123211602 [Mangifera indica]|uniref:uncharacterized protein LOC123211602 n=1 Tax=Mangifera indica TaxID=29780 RepID=UPI001CFA0D93|nr:uncharacterized protein LOC123211602 [Mangifera indica]
MASNILRGTLVHSYRRYNIRAFLNHEFQDFWNPIFVKYISTKSNEQSFTVSYLINSCGLSPESALTASKKLQLETPEKADLVLTFFKNSGFSEAQISDLIRRYPLLLLSNPERNLRPKLEFFHSKGFLSSDLASVLSRCPTILRRSLNNHIIPSVAYLCNLLQSTEKVTALTKWYPSILTCDLQILVVPKINVLRDMGVPETHIVRLFYKWPMLFTCYSHRFNESVNLLKKMGMNPLTSLFVKAIVVMSVMPKAKWDKKVDFYKRLGWSKEEILAAFQKNPWCMMTSEDKIMAVMDVFVNKMGWTPSAIAERPQLFSLSVAKRIIPRAAVVQFLSTRGLLKNNLISLSPYIISDEAFLHKYMNCYDEAPQLKKLYKEKLDHSKMTKHSIIFAIMASNILRGTLVHGYRRYTIRAFLNHEFQDFWNPIFVKCISTKSNEQSFTVSYLINSCGLSPESALTASKKLQLETPEKADLALTFFKNSGFSETQISNLIRRCPLLLLSNPERNLRPKLQFFHSKGFSTTDLATVLSQCPHILGRSLNKRIIPSFTYLCNLLQSTEKVIAVTKRFHSILTWDLQVFVATKVNVLRGIGVPETLIVRLLYKWPIVFTYYSGRFDETVDLLRKMGMNPSKSQFVVAIVVMSIMPKAKWDKKVDFYKRLGWSKEEVFAAFQKNPWCMMTSEDKIMAVMDIFVNKMGWTLSAIAERPHLFSYSLEKRIIPRAAVVQFLSSKGLLKNGSISLSPYTISDEAFLHKYMNCYDEAPQLKKLYKEKLDRTMMTK